MLELDTITLKKPAVLAMKDSISWKLQQIDHTLQSAKRQWNQELINTRNSKTPIYGVYHDTSKHFFFATLSLSVTEILI